jgi:hypothetical protein
MLPWDGRAAPGGSLRVEGAITTTDVIRKSTPVYEGIPLHVPKMTVDGAALIAVARVFELGVRYSYGFYSDRNVTAIGTAPVPTESPTTGFGPEFRGTIRFGKSGDFALGIGGNFLVYSVPTVIWVPDSTCTLGPTCVDSSTTSTLFGPPDRYRLDHEDTRNEAVLNFALLANYQFGGGRFGHVFGGVGNHTGFENGGLKQNTRESGPVALLGGGYGIKIDPFRVAVSVSKAVTTSSSPVNYGVSGFLTLGVDIQLWTPARKPSEQKSAPPQQPPPGYYSLQPPPGPTHPSDEPKPAVQGPAPSDEPPPDAGAPKPEGAEGQGASTMSPKP